jgi:ABC-type uncharacterized transport system auxiliary subunit
MFSALRVFAVCLLAAAVLSACSIGGKKELKQERRYYILQAGEVAPYASRQQYGTLQIDRYSVSPGFAAREIVIRTGENAFQADYYNVFLVPPSDVVTRVVKGHLQSSKLFEYVIGQDTTTRHDFSLQGSVTALYGDFSKAADPKAVVEIRTFLMDRPEDSRILSVHDFRREIPIAVKSMDGVVQAFNAAMTQYLAELDAFLGETLQNTQ